MYTHTQRHINYTIPVDVEIEKLSSNWKRINIVKFISQIKFNFY